MEIPGPPTLTRMIVVDDDPRVRAALSATMAIETDLSVVGEASGALTAWAMAEATDPAVALVDLLLPDGPEGLALIRRLAARPGCGVVAMSVQAGLAPAAIAAGAAAFVEKGGDIDAILSAVRATARASRVQVK